MYLSKNKNKSKEKWKELKWFNKRESLCINTCVCVANKNKQFKSQQNFFFSNNFYFQTTLIFKDLFVCMHCVSFVCLHV